jgi:hypothetical protein
MTQSSAQPHGSESARWTTRYEDLRRQVLEDPAGSGWGRSLFVSRGLLSWMAAWPPDNDRGPSTGVPATQTAADTPALYSGLYREMTRVLVNMILSTREAKT